MTFETFARDVEAALIKRGVSEGEAFNAIGNYGAVISERYKAGGYSAARVAEEIDLHRSGFDDAAERVRTFSEVKAPIQVAPRDKSTGEYTHSRDRLCGCDHTLGSHSATTAGGSRPCFEAGCACDKFRAPRTQAHKTASKHKTKMPTYAAAREALFAYLRTEGWKLDTSLKIPHATSPDHRTRVWFKAQAVYVDRDMEGYGGRFNFKSARSSWLDIRAISPAQFAKDVQT